jgi:hypothetical protein
MTNKKTPNNTDKVKRNKDKRFDLSLSKAEVFEQEFAKIFAEKKIELKTELDWWQKTGNICIEYFDRGKPSGIATTEADYWAHELRAKDGTVAYLLIPTARLKEMMDNSGKVKKGIGDDRGVEAILIPIKNLFDKWITGK